ncbi:cache domain-containing protein [bacterium]|nr:cache domain-containing protein [bacterium]
MKNLVKLALIGAALVFSSLLMAGDYGSREEAKAMTERAAALAKEIGIEAASKEFHDKDGEFFDRDLYVFAYNNDGVLLAFGAKQHMVGKNMWNFKDFEGKLIVQDFLAIKPGTTEWIDYKWQNPVSGRIDHKDTYIIRTDDYLVAVGYYTDDFYQASNE